MDIFLYSTKNLQDKQNGHAASNRFALFKLFDKVYWMQPFNFNIKSNRFDLWKTSWERIVKEDIREQTNTTTRIQCHEIKLMKPCMLGRNISIIFKFNLFWKFHLVTLDSRRRIALFLYIFHDNTHCKIHRIRRTAYPAVLPSYTQRIVRCLKKLKTKKNQSSLSLYWSEILEKALGELKINFSIVSIDSVTAKIMSM